MKATIVSLCPSKFHQHIPFVFPQTYHIEPSDMQIPQVLTIGEAYYLLPNPASEDLPHIKITKTGKAIADSIVYDWMHGCVDRTEFAYPAVFVIDDEISPTAVLKNHAAKVADALARQKEWFKILVKRADDDWQQYRSHRVISDLNRIAAKALNLDREWIALDNEMLSCPNCGQKVLSTQAVCSCRCILNADLYKKLQFAEVK